MCAGDGCSTCDGDGFLVYKDITPEQAEKMLYFIREIAYDQPSAWIKMEAQRLVNMVGRKV